ncbi:MAG TPA: site-specific integrase [Bacteroidota bacterium]|nr:site-specific integrase [Bacteroidota bacterium]
MRGKLGLYRRANGIYYIRERGEDVDRWFSTGKRTKAEALQVFRSWSPEQPKPKFLTLSDAREEILLFVTLNYSLKSHELYRLSLDSLIRILGNKDVRRVSLADVDRFISVRRGEISGTSVNMQIRTLRSAFNMLLRWERIAKNPFAGVKQIRVPDVPPVFLTREQFAKLHQVVAKTWIRDIVVIAVCTGMRAGEILNLEWRHVDLGKRVIHVVSSPTFKTKTGGQRIVPLNDTAQATLIARPQDTKYVFDDHGHPYRRDSVSAAFKRCVRVAGLPDAIHFHSLRHTFASWLVQDGVSLYQVGKLLGHSTIRVTQMYAHLQPDAMHDLVERIQLQA